MSHKYKIQFADRPKGAYLVNTRRYIANTRGINTFWESVAKLEGAVIDSNEKEIGTYLKELIASINEKYSDASISILFHKNWHGGNCHGFDVYSRYCHCPVGDIFLIGINKTAHFIEEGKVEEGGKE